MQAYIVAGGIDYYFNEIKYAEIFEPSKRLEWTRLQSLPNTVSYVRGITVNNKVFMIGKPFNPRLQKLDSHSWSMVRLNSVKNTNFRLDNKKLFLMH